MDKRLEFNFQNYLTTILVLSLIAVSLASLEFTSLVLADHQIVSKQLVAGHNIVSYRDVANSQNNTNTITINQSEFYVGDDVEITVFDDAANLDPSGLDQVTANISSTSSASITAFATLTESDSNSAVFAGTITLSSNTTTGSVLETNEGDVLTLIYEPKDYHESARFQADITTSGNGTVELTDYFVDDSTKAGSACPFHPVTHAVDLSVSGTTASNILVTISYANALGVDNISNTPNFLKIGYRNSPGTGFTSLNPNGDYSGHDFSAKTVTNVNQPASVNGQYVLGFETGCPGGGGGGLIRPSLVVNALAGIGALGGGGGADFSPPTISLENLINYPAFEVPLEIEQMVVNQDSSLSLPPMSLGLYENFDYPLVINESGFVLGGFSNIIETQSLNTNEPNKIRFTLYESTKIQHISLYTNLRGANTAIHQSDTQILYYDGLPIQVKDPNGFFSDVSVTIEDIGENKKQAVFEITFAKEMDTSDIVIRAWDPKLNSRDTYILDAIKIVQENIPQPSEPTYEEPIILEAHYQTIPIWIKNNAAWWSDEQIEDSDFIAGLEYLIQNGIIAIPDVQKTTSSASEIPDWIKNNAGWWSDSLITDSDFLEAMEWLVANGVIHI